MEAAPNPKVLELIGAGRKIEAIKLVREETGWDLARAKEYVERIGSGRNSEPLPHREEAPSLEIPPEIRPLLAERKTIDAIRLLRERTGCGLKEAKERVEEIARSEGLGPARTGCLGALALSVVLLALACALLS